jgi:micrococcal nuclease
MFQRCKTYCLFFLVALLSLVASAAIAQTLFGKVTRVADGDTVAFKVHNGAIKKVRLADIDTPERDQPWGTEATIALRQWSMSKPARIEVVHTDRYGRLVAILWVDDENINRRLVEEGHAALGIAFGTN